MSTLKNKTKGNKTKIELTVITRQSEIAIAYHDTCLRTSSTSQVYTM